MADAWGTRPLVWEVGALCKAADNTLAMRFGAVSVRGELSGFTRAGSGHCYFTLKDAQGQLRCAMFRRAAQALNFAPRDGASVQLQGRLGVYEARGDLQLVVEHMQPVGQGALYEQFLQIKARLQAQGLFDADRKRPLPAMPRGIGLVTSLGAAALHDVLSALRRRAAHLPVWLVPARVQGADAPRSLIAALQKMYDAVLVQEAKSAEEYPGPYIDLILLVRGGGSLEDLWAFNDEQLAQTIARSPVPLVSGVGHETDFSIADFVADLRAPTPTAAAEMASAARETLLADLLARQARLGHALERRLQKQAQRLDAATARLVRPAQWLHAQRLSLADIQSRMRHALLRQREREMQGLAHAERRLAQAGARQRVLAGERIEQLRETLRSAQQREWTRQNERLARVVLRLDLLDPQRVLDRGYSLLMGEAGQVLARVNDLPPGTALRARVSDGSVDMTVTQPRLI